MHLGKWHTISTNQQHNLQAVKDIEYYFGAHLESSQLDRQVIIITIPM